ncbi:hypothetical protein GF312_01445 [Candidatus Poribacteria bacterium]|nr:hypothetical protein [Candidatus Poribacteria bacterium]
MRMFKTKYYNWIILTTVATIFLFVSNIQAQEFVTDGLISFWTFDENTFDGDTLRDTWGQNHGTLKADATSTGDGMIGGALELDGAGDFVNIENPQDIPVGEDEYAIEVWFFTDMMKIGGIIGWGAWGSSNQVNALRIGTDVNGFRHYWWGNDLDHATGDISGQWHHLIAQYDGTTRSLWMDGEMLTSDQPANHNAQLQDVNIGVTNNRTEFWDGRLDEMRLYNRGLTDDEIAQNFNVKSNVIAVAPAGKLATCWGKIRGVE